MQKKEKKVDELKFFKLEKFKKNENDFYGILKEHLSKQIVFIALVVVIIIYIFYHISEIGNFFVKIINILMPIIIGWILTYLIAPLYNIVIDYFLSKKVEGTTIEKKFSEFAKPIATIVCALVILLIGTGLIIMFVPQLYSSISNFVGKMGNSLNEISDLIETTKNNQKNELLIEILLKIEATINSIKEEVKGMDITKLLENFEVINLSKVFQSVSKGFSVSMKFVLNVFVGLVVMIYTLNMKTELIRGCKRFLFAICRKDVAQKMLNEIEFAHKVFSGFLVGKLLDSLIIGVICYICCLFLTMPYTPLIALIVGVTNIIPFFGPFVGAIPSFLIVFLEEPLSWRPYGLLLFIFLLQQLDGNVIGPKILGDKTGVKPFWVLFSILLFGGLFGFIGMIIAVPMWAVITRLFEEVITAKLKAKGYPLTTEDYQKLKEYNLTLEKNNKIKKQKN